MNIVIPDPLIKIEGEYEYRTPFKPTGYVSSVTINGIPVLSMHRDLPYEDSYGLMREYLDDEDMELLREAVAKEFALRLKALINREEH